jgi:dipeptidyl aminopeptidase/acylaminoacyl peptidase
MAFYADKNLAVRAVQATRPDGGMEIRVLDSGAGGTARWRTIVAAGAEDVIQLHALDAGGTGAIMWSSLGHNAAQLVVRPFARGGASERLLAGEEEIDAGDVLYDRRTRRVQAVSFAANRAVWKAIDSSVASDLSALAKLEDGDFQVVDRSNDDRTWLVAFTSDAKPVHYYIWSRPNRSGTLLFSQRPALDALTLARMRPVVIRSRDGLDLNAFLTLPPGVEPRRLPLVLMVHGGPWSRDQWGFDPTTQWLANRGYAVLRVNYRGSSGYGKRFIAASFKQWGRGMLDDLVDAVDWAVQEGVADPQRLAVYGSSYGGYATLAALTFAPSKFACGVDMFGPSHLRTFIESVPPQWKPMRAVLDTRIGNVDDPADLKLLEEVSPLAHADRIRRPLLIAQGARDPRVKRAESDRMVEALRGRKAEVEYVVYPDEGHGFSKPANRVDFQSRAERFLAKCLGGRSEAPAAPAAPATERPPEGQGLKPSALREPVGAASPAPAAGR